MTKTEPERERRSFLIAARILRAVKRVSMAQRQVKRIANRIVNDPELLSATLRNLEAARTQIDLSIRQIRQKLARIARP